MVYAMNLYDIRAGKEDVYKEYMKRSAEVAVGIDAEPLIAGHSPLQTMVGKQRSHFAVVRFACKSDFEKLMDRHRETGINLLREEATENYIWTLYEDWDIGAWLKSN